MALLDDRVAIVTGASSGIGRATAKLFASEGARVVVCARRAAPLEAVVAEITRDGGVGIAVVGDVASEEVAARLVGSAMESFGRLDVACNNAGTLGPLKPVSEIDRSEWDEALAVNLTSAFLAAKYQVPAMVRSGGGSIVFVSTFVGYSVGFPGMAAYAASKAGLLGLTQVLASEYGSARVRVNALLPGGTDTPMGAVVADTPEARAGVMGLHALGRMADPEEIAGSALFLASHLSSFTTGASVLADGGVSIHRP